MCVCVCVCVYVCTYVCIRIVIVIVIVMITFFTVIVIEDCDFSVIVIVIDQK